MVTGCYHFFKMKTLKIISIFFSVVFYFGMQYSFSQSVIPIPNIPQQAFQNAAVGVLISYDLEVFDEKKYNQEENRITPIAGYNMFTPTRLNTDQWIKVAKEAGAKFAILTATHETGFALYQSDVNPYCMKALKWKDGKGDIVRDFVNSCRKYGIKPGIFLDVRWDSFFGVYNFKVEGKGKFQEDRQQYFNKMCEGMVKELCTRYGSLFMFWFDGGASDPKLGAPDVLPVIKKYQPGCIFYHNAQSAEVRWGGAESGTVGYPCWAGFPYPSIDVVKYPEVAQNGNILLKHGDPDGKFYTPAFADIPLRGYNGRHDWFWQPGGDAHVFPLHDLLEMYDKSVGRNATLILGLTPDTAGLIPGGDEKRLREFGDAVKKRFDYPLATEQGSGNKIMIHFKKPEEVNQITLGEDITKGERIRQYKVEALTDGKWKEICKGTSVGHERIQVFDPVKAKFVRLVIEKAAGMPYIHFFNAYFVPQN